MERLFELTSETLPYQNTSPYEVVTGNLYDYARQVNTLLNLPDIVIAPAKVLLEKFPSNTFFENNSFKSKSRRKYRPEKSSEQAYKIRV